MGLEGIRREGRVRTEHRQDDVNLKSWILPFKKKKQSTRYWN